MPWNLTKRVKDKQNNIDARIARIPKENREKVVKETKLVVKGDMLLIENRGGTIGGDIGEPLIEFMLPNNGKGFIIDRNLDEIQMQHPSIANDQAIILPYYDYAPKVRGSEFVQSVYSSQSFYDFLDTYKSKLTGNISRIIVPLNYAGHIITCCADKNQDGETKITFIDSMEVANESSLNPVKEEVINGFTTFTQKDVTYITQSSSLQHGAVNACGILTGFTAVALLQNPLADPLAATLDAVSEFDKANPELKGKTFSEKIHNARPLLAEAVRLQNIGLVLDEHNIPEIAIAEAEQEADIIEKISAATYAYNNHNDASNITFIKENLQLLLKDANLSGDEMRVVEEEFIAICITSFDKETGFAIQAPADYLHDLKKDLERNYKPDHKSISECISISMPEPEVQLGQKC